MRKTMFLIICLIMLAVLIGCETSINVPVKDSSQWGTDETAMPEQTPDPSSDETPAGTVSAQPTLAATPQSTPAATPTETPSATPKGPSLYSSYAHMMSYDPAKGLADFDFFDLLQGADAVKWLVEHEGYSQADAEAEVAGYADSEFIEKNTNKQLRTVDLDGISITLMFDPDTGEMLEVDHPFKGSLIDLYKLYELDHDLVLNNFFYWIEVKNGQVISVQQVYWP